MRNTLVILQIKTSFSGQLTIALQEDDRPPYRGYLHYDRGLRQVDWELYPGYNPANVTTEWERELYPGEKEQAWAAIQAAISQPVADPPPGYAMLDGTSWELTVTQGGGQAPIKRTWQVLPAGWGKLGELVQRWLLSVSGTMLPLSAELDF